MILPFLNANVILTVALAVGISGIGGYAAGIRHERQAAEARYHEELSNALDKARILEQNKAAELRSVADAYEKRLSAVDGRANAYRRELGRLRVSVASSERLPTVAACPGASDATAGRTVGVGTREVNLDDVAGEIIQLGADLDRARETITGLQDVVRSYEPRGK